MPRGIIRKGENMLPVLIIWTFYAFVMTIISLVNFIVFRVNMRRGVGKIVDCDLNKTFNEREKVTYNFQIDCVDKQFKLFEYLSEGGTKTYNGGDEISVYYCDHSSEVVVVKNKLIEVMKWPMIFVLCVIGCIVLFAIMASTE